MTKHSKAEIQGRQLRKWMYVLNVGFTYAYQNLIFLQAQQMHECVNYY
jgi:hypothetical protein